MSFPFSQRRINVFAFPASTDSRFVLLIALVISVSLFMFSFTTGALPVVHQYVTNTYLSCEDAIKTSEVLLAKMLQNPHDFARVVASDAAYKTAAGCIAPANRLTAGLSLGGVLCVLLGTGILYWTYPVRILRRRHLSPITPEDDSDLSSGLDALCREAELPKSPTFVWNPFDPSASGMAFGHVGHRYVALGGGLVGQFYKDRPAFRAVMLHELAHVRNGDLDKTYLTVAVWQAFVMVALLPYVLTLIPALFSRHATVTASGALFTGTFAWQSFLRVLVLAALVLLTRNAVLRARELFADARAAGWAGPNNKLVEVLRSLVQRPEAGWHAAFHVHPTPAQREQALRVPERLLATSLWEVFATGVAVSVAYPEVVVLFTQLSLPLPSFQAQPSLALYAWTALLFAPLVSGVVGLGVWRAVFVAAVHGRNIRGTGRLGIVLGAGILLGGLLSISVDPSHNRNAAGTSLNSLPGVLWGSAFVLAMFLLCRWAAGVASVWLETAAARRTAGRMCLAYLTGITVPLASLLFFLFGGLYWLSGKPLSIPVVGVLLLNAFSLLIGNPVMLVLVILFWAVPFTTSLWPARAVAGAKWAYLELASGATVPTLRQLPRLRPQQATRLGIIGGLAAGAVVLGFRLIVRAGVPDSTRSTDAWKVLFSFMLVALVVLIQVCIAVAAARRAERLPVAHGLLAAFIAGTLGTVAFLALNVAFGGTLNGSFVWTIWLSAVNVGALLALPSASLASLLSARALRPPPMERRPAPALWGPPE